MTILLNLNKDKYYMSPFYYDSKRIKLRSKENNGGCQGLGEGEKKELLIKEYKISVLDICL